MCNWYKHIEIPRKYVYQPKNNRKRQTKVKIIFVKVIKSLDDRPVIFFTKIVSKNFLNFLSYFYLTLPCFVGPNF